MKPLFMRVLQNMRMIIIEDTELTPIIIVGKSTGNYSQDFYSFGQEIIVEKVIKGLGIEENTTYFVYGTDGFSIDEFGNFIYTNVKNIMKKDLSYLIFLEPSLLNQYEQTSKSY